MTGEQYQSMLDRGTRRETPMEPDWQSRRDEEQPASHELPPLWDVVGKLRFLADRTRADIKAAVGKLSCYQIHPTDMDYRAAVRIIQYLHTYPDIGPLLRHGKYHEGWIEPIGSCDASHLSDVDCRPRLGYEVRLFPGGASVMTKSIKAGSVATSTFQAELMAADEFCKETDWLKGLLKELEIDQSDGTNTTIMQTDSRSVLDVILGEAVSHKSRHLIAKIHEVRQYHRLKEICAQFVPSVDNRSDLLTKPLPAAAHWKLTNLVMGLGEDYEPDYR